MDVQVVDGVVQPVAAGAGVSAAGVGVGSGVVFPVAGVAVDAAGDHAAGGLADRGADAAGPADAAVGLAGVGWDGLVGLVAERDGLARRVGELSGALDAERLRWAAVVADAHVWADENNLCSVFDEFCSEHGLATRSADFEVSVDVRVRVVLCQTARDADAAESEVDDAGASDRVVQAIYDLARGDLDDAVIDWSVAGVEGL